MAIELFKHNETAYKAAVAMLKETGKAAVIHPTGTGKSFIGFKLCEENPSKTVCWLSPSEYIFKTQLEALKKSADFTPANVKFFTYSKLMNLEESEISDIKPDFIVLDEFHRAGAEQWGIGVKKLLSAYPEAPILGLSATNIRYLDNQRDMADELFDGCIASEMTLGEAIVRGILNPPKYVLSIYSYQKDLERYERRVKTAKNKVVRDAAERYLEALRRALDKADGLDKIFAKHMTDPHGKYIVFCANAEHMRAMMAESKAWFRGIDQNYHVYSVYSDDPEASQSFADFKVDGSDHLRLLFCIDALNEGIHVDDVAGVILLRPTVSPIIYKQQIGRALSASSTKNPVIFDIVNNISGLYSISSLQDEMDEIVRYYQYLGENHYIVNQRFEIFDDLKDCKRIFDELETALSASWEYMFDEAKAYFKRFGDLLPGNDYVTEDGMKLGKWLVTQRINYRNGSGISQSRIEKLNSIGMDWRTLHERQWDEGYELARAYFERFKDLEPDRESFPKVSLWLSRQRQKYRENQLTEDQIARLNAIDMTWEFEDDWDKKFAEASEYYKTRGNLDVSAAYVTENGTALGAWLRGMRERRKAGKLSEERIGKLESIGMSWSSAGERSWEACYDLAKRFYEVNGNLNIGAAYVLDGVKLGNWISSQRVAYKQGGLSEERVKKLELIGMSWQRQGDRWNAAYARAEEYYKVFGKLNPQAGYVDGTGFALGAWVAAQRRKFGGGKLRKNQIERLDELKIIWSPTEAVWRNGFDHARIYVREKGDLNVPAGYICDDGYALGNWVAAQKKSYFGGRLSGERISALEGIGISWSRNADRWDKGYGYAKSYRSGGGDLPIPQTFVTADGYPLGEWVRSQERRFRSGRLESEKVKKLAEIGVKFKVGERFE